MQCSEIMLRRPFFVTLDQPVSAAAAQMRGQNVGFLPVCDQHGKVVGALTDRDIVDRLVAAGGAATTPVSELMSAEVFAIDASAQAEGARGLLDENNVERLVCLDADGKLAGIVGRDQLGLGNN